MGAIVAYIDVGVMVVSIYSPSLGGGMSKPPSFEAPEGFMKKGMKLFSYPPPF